MIAGAGAADVGCVGAADAWLDRLRGQGFAVRDGVLPEALTRALAGEAERLRADEALRRAGVGRADDHELNARVRRDKVAWLDASTLAQVQYLEAMEQVRLEVNRELLLGVFAFEAHFAVYEPGAFYARHVDAFRGARNRVLSTVLYLNHDWREGDGGELAVYPPDSAEDAPPQELVAPVAGRMAFFLSEEIPHAVLTANAARYSIAGWFRVREDV